MVSTLLTYAAVKFIAYSAWSYCGLLIADFGATLRPDNLQRLHMSLAMGMVRWALGFSFGVLVAIVVRQKIDGSFFVTYIAVYGPVRFIEWGLLAHLWFRSWQDKWLSLRLYAWILIGIVVSFAADLASPEFVEQGRFCFGRCLC